MTDNRCIWKVLDTRSPHFLVFRLYRCHPRLESKSVLHFVPWLYCGFWNSLKKMSLSFQLLTYFTKNHPLYRYLRPEGFFLWNKTYIGTLISEMMWFGSECRHPYNPWLVTSQQASNRGQLRPSLKLFPIKVVPNLALAVPKDSALLPL